MSEPGIEGLILNFGRNRCRQINHTMAAMNATEISIMLTVTERPMESDNSAGKAGCPPLAIVLNDRIMPRIVPIDDPTMQAKTVSAAQVFSLRVVRIDK